MRVSAPLVCFLLAVSLPACSSNSQKQSAKGPDSRGAAKQVAAEPATVRRSPAYIRASATGRYASGGGAAGVTGDFAGYPAVDRLIDRLEREEGFDREYLERVFSRVERQQWILDFLNRPKSKGPTRPTGAWTRYRAKFVTQDNIGNGARFWRRYESVLERAHADYGVPPEYVVAILGVETRYGGYTGKHRVIEALSTIAFDYPRRSEFFTGELEAFLIMSRDEGFDPFTPKGSYAGAMGLGQFMPSSFRRFAVDYDGDGKRDLWNPVDAIGSVANYFAAHGWREGEPVTVRAKVQGSGAKAMKTGFDTSYSLGALSRRGVVSSVSLDGSGDVSLLRLDAKGGYEYWLGLENFYVITRYNHSSYYAMAVHQLAQSVRARHGPSKGLILSERGGADREPAL
ncbi:MAG: lytic murein transglycosylase B [Pseudomonadota bacterium]|nr:lytic murein transglycosylase B [Pseudomonadota bacterium]